MTPFSPDFATARAAFREAALAAGATLDQHEHPERGPDGDTVSTDVAWIGPVDAPRVLVIASGTHGVEGVAGSGLQTEWLNRGEAANRSGDMAILLIHAINPWGFAWLRRVTHENVDLNRNWIDFAAPLPENPDYDELAQLLLPETLTPDTMHAILAGLGEFAARRGPMALRAATGSGQYGHPDGIFFGGTGPTWSRLTLTAILRERLGQARHVGIIDYHTGLGPEGVAEQMVSAAPGSPAALRAAAWYGLGVVPIGSIGSASMQTTTGDWASSVSHLLPDACVTDIVPEFGTRPIADVIAALIADNWLHMRGDPRSPAGHAIRQTMLATFYGDNDLWRGMAIGQALLTCRHAIAALKAAAL